MHIIFILESFFSKDFFFKIFSSIFQNLCCDAKKILLPPQIALEPVFRWNIKEQRREKNRKE